MRFHLCGLPWAIEPQDAYGGKHLRWSTMMAKRGHEVVVHDALPEEYDPAHTFDPASPSWVAMNTRVAEDIAVMKQPRDFICLIAGRCQQAIAEAHPDLTAAEYGIGYGGTFARFRVFESYAWMHAVYGAQTGGNPHSIDGRFYDAVIPNYYDPAEFPFIAEPHHDPYFLYIGRLIERKGVTIAAEICKRLGVRLLLAGEGDTRPSYGEYVGVVSGTEKAALIGGATAVLMPTTYCEPFGGVTAEANLCGVPVIATDWGAPTETIEHGVTGFRCHTMGEFMEAARRAPELDRAAIAHKARQRWSMDAVGEQYERYFERLMTLWGDGFYDENPGALARPSYALGR